ncbi:MAG: type II toxin-antitoxin system PemK/MazF family toxin [Phycisphaerae bacterium]
MKRGEVRWYKFPQPDKRRPVLILHRTEIIECLGEVTIAPLTSTIRDIPTEVYLTREDGMKQDCVVNLDHIQTVSKGRIGSLITTLSNARMTLVNQAICFALDL